MAKSRNEKRRTVSANVLKSKSADEFGTAAQAMRAGRIEEAQSICVEILKADPAHLSAMHLLSSIFFQTGRKESAAEMMERLAALNPRNPQVLSDLGFMQHELGDNKKAEHSLNLALKLAPGLASAHVNLGNLYRSIGSFPLAEKSYKTALHYKPGMLIALANLSSSQLQAGRVEDAEKYAREAIRLNPDFAMAHTRLGSVFDRLGRFEAAIEAHERALELQPGSVDSVLECAASYMGYGKMDKALELYRQVIKLSPTNVVAYVAIARIESFEHKDDPVIVAMERIVADQGLAESDRKILAYSLGKAYEDCQNFEATYALYCEANAYSRKVTSYSKQQTDDQFREMKVAFPKGRVAQFSGMGSTEQTPIFVCGMPRSGTTLVEQILSSHKDVVGAGELSGMRTAINALRGPQKKLTLDQAISSLSQNEISELGAQYLTELRAFSGDSAFCVDKMLENN